MMRMMVMHIVAHMFHFIFFGCLILCIIVSRLAESEPYCHSILFAWMSVGHSTTYSLPRLIDHNQIWYAGTYNRLLSSLTN